MPSSDLGDVLQFLNTINPIVSDMASAGETVRKSFESNYLQKIYDAAKSEKEKVKKNPSREITMLRAFKNYAARDTASRIDNIISTLTLIGTIRSINTKISVQQKESPQIQSASKDSGVQPNRQFTELTGIIMALSLISGK